MAHKRRKNKINKKTIIKIVILLVILIVVIVAGMKFLKRKVTQNFAQSSDVTVQTAEVTSGSISTTVSGSGTLADEESETTEIPSTVTISKVYVNTGDKVEEGDLLATVDSASVLSSMSDLQSEIDELDEKLAEAEDDAADNTISATVSGRVKVIEAAVDDDVATVMYKKGALMRLSLDGYLAVDVDAGDLEAGKEVTVEVGDDTYTGTVDTILNKVATVLISDEAAEVGATATVTSANKTVGSGKLYIHESLAVTGYAGTVSTISVSVNDKVSQGTTLMSLTDTSYSANYTAILKERSEMEEKLQNLIVIYKKGAVYASITGTITEATDNSASSSSTSNSQTAASAYGSMSSSSNTSSTTTSSDSVFAICPNEEMILTVSVDETNISSVSEGQEANISVDSIENQTFTGKVTAIETSGTSSSGVTTYNVEITLAKETNMLSGMSASATITIEGKDNTLIVPADAVNKTRESAYVYTTYDEENDSLGGMVEVTTGISNGSYTEIVEGLTEGQTVYYKESSNTNDFPFGGRDMPSGFGDGNMPSGFGDGNMPSGDFGGGGNMPSMPSGGSGNMPSMPSGNN